jgi:hypothetical protein
MAQVRVNSSLVITFQNVLPVSAEPSFNTVSAILYSGTSTEEIASSGLLMKFSLVVKKTEKRQLSCLSLKILDEK